MNKQKWLMLIAVLGLLALTAGLLDRLKRHQALGRPGVKTQALADSKRLQICLPEQVLDYTSEPVETDQTALDMLPKDTSLGQRTYRAPDGFGVGLGVVLMGSDRTSLHPPQFCLRGSGWVIQKTEEETVPMTLPKEYSLPVTKLTLVPEPGSPVGDRRRLYVYWFVADNEYTRDHYQRMWWMFRDQVTTGVLQRWAYITYITECAPGQETAAFERLKKMIAASVPEFQLTPRAAGTIAGVGQ
jgi:hypothetical protein